MERGIFCARFANNDYRQRRLKGCENLTKIVLPASIRTIESGAFANCTSLKEIVFTGDFDGLTIKSGAFENCTSLEKITLPAGLTGLEDKAFSGCVKLKDIYVEAEIAVPINKDDRPFEIIDGMRIHIKKSAMSSYSASWEAYAQYLVAIEEE
ncbi:MAG: leucine-rich repeat domain-containing protein [Christensenellales bacterium]